MALDLAHRPEEESTISNKVFVGNLNYQTTQEEVMDLFSPVGDIVEVFMPSDRATGRPRGFAFVEYTNPDAAAEAIEKLDGADLGGRQIRVNLAEARPPRVPSFGADRPPQRGRGGGGSNKGSRRGARARKRSL